MELERENSAKPRACAASQTRTIGAVAIVAGLLSACAGDALGVREPPPQPQTPPPLTEPALLTLIREDFINRQLVERTSGVEVDYNTGFVTLPTRTFPSTDGVRLLSYANETMANGIVAAEEIIVEENGIVRASDSIELAAKGILRVTGQIRAGRGGVTLAAGDKVLIDGSVESEGPVKILLAHESGTIEVSGHVLAKSSPDGLTPSVELVGRGNVVVTGLIGTDAATGPASGDIIIDTYGDITLTEYGQIATVALGGRAGSIRLKSESQVQVFNGARIGGEMRALGVRNEETASTGGEIQLEAQHVNIGSNGSVLGASSELGEGGSIAIAAGAQLTVDSSGIVVAGNGMSGGTVAIQALAVDLREGSLVAGGTGIAQAGIVRVEVAESLRLAPLAAIAGGDGGCTAGGMATIHVAGVLTLERDAGIRGGAGGTLVGQYATCREQLHKGGDVEVVARAIDGVTEMAIVGGAGSTPGSVMMRIDPEYEVPPVNLTVATHGFVVSRLIDRGEAARGQIPVLVDLQYMAPPVTSVELSLGATDDPNAEIDNWIAAGADSKTALEPLRDLRYFRYRVSLAGRAFDSPVLDFFEIDLAPRNSLR